MSRQLTAFGPQQLPNWLGIPRWQCDRAVRLGLIPGPDRASGRWSRALADTIRERLDHVVETTGSVPDMGATRAAEHLTARLGIEVTPDAVTELARHGTLRTVGTYKDHPLYDGRDIEDFEDHSALQAAGEAGQQLQRDEAANRLGVREVDVRHLDRAGYLVPVRYARSRWQPRHAAPCVPLYRAGDVTALQERDDIDWPAVRAAVGPGRRSPFAALQDR